jgi:hypothetical protein
MRSGFYLHPNGYSVIYVEHLPYSDTYLVYTNDEIYYHVGDLDKARKLENLIKGWEVLE